MYVCASSRPSGCACNGVIRGCSTVLAGALLEQAEQLLVRGIHPSVPPDGYKLVTKIAVDRLEEINNSFPVDVADTVSCSDGHDIT